MLDGKNNGFKSEIMLFSNLKVLVMSAFFVALSIVCGKFLAFNLGTVMRFSFENLPILLAAVAFGPLVGGMTAIVADLVGCLLVGYEINPLVTIGALCIGVLGGLVFKLLHRMRLFLRLVFTVLTSHLIGSVLVKTVGLSAFYSIPFEALLLWRLLNYVIIGVLELLLLYYLMRSKAVTDQIERIKHK